MSFQATINLVIGYDPPPNAVPNLNDPQAGDATMDAGMFIIMHFNAVKIDSSLVRWLISHHFVFLLRRGWWWWWWW